MDTQETEQGAPDGSADLKQPWKAVFLTQLFTGIGHVYVGARTKGYFLIALAIILDLVLLGALIGFIAATDQGATKAALLALPVAGLLLFVVQLFALVDSFRIAKKGNTALSRDPHAGVQKKSWLSAFLSCLFPGIGQLYNGNVLKAIVFAVAALALSAMEEHFYPLILLSAALGFFAITDAFDSAEKRNGSSARFLYQGNALLVFVMVMTFLSAPPYGALIKDNFVRAYKIPAGSMIPTLLIGDQLLVDKRQATLNALKPGDIVVFPYPRNPEKTFIKRIVAMSGDKVQIIQGDLSINDKPVPKQLIETRPAQGIASSGDASQVKIYSEDLGGHTHTIQQFREDREGNNSREFIVPEDSVFLLGDNRDNSQDSRFWGTVSKDTIEGKAIKLYWSWDGDKRKVNWERIGQMIQ